MGSRALDTRQRQDVSKTKYRNRMNTYKEWLTAHMADAARRRPPGPMRERLGDRAAVAYLVGFGNDGAPVEWLDVDASPGEELRYRNCYLFDNERVCTDVFFGCPLRWSDSDGFISLVCAGAFQGGFYNDSRLPVKTGFSEWDIAGVLSDDTEAVWARLRAEGVERRKKARDKSKAQKRMMAVTKL